ncbi:MAG: hypothetical protein KF773_10475 [Deltaproteobacteria bacterium]|nr:hypothetical protein [Deltaproteobacteria bacterium]
MRRLAIAAALAACGSSPGASPDGTPPVDGACTHAAPGQPARVGTVGAPSSELSGLVASANGTVLYTLADSGNPAEVYALDARTAGLRGTLRLTGATNVDWEDLARGPCELGDDCIFVADTGDNRRARASVRFYAFRDEAAPGDVASVAFDVAYPDGGHDVEAVFVDPRDGEVYGIEKVEAADPVVWRYPRAAPATAAQVARLDLAALAGDRRVTSADVRVDACGVHLLVRTRDHLVAYEAPADEAVVELVARAPVRMPVADEPQGEAVAWRADGRGYFTVSEGANPTLFQVAR